MVSCSISCAVVYDGLLQPHRGLQCTGAFFGLQEGDGAQHDCYLAQLSAFTNAPVDDP
jgi:hypothetical protein